MGEISLDRRFDLQASCDAIVGHYHGILTEAFHEAFHERQRQVGGEAVLLDAVVEIAQAHGFPANRVTAERILQIVGRFEVGMTPRGKLAVWQKS
jgi:UTP-glucose-1-phosphate uridylyltransferase